MDYDNSETSRKKLTKEELRVSCGEMIKNNISMIKEQIFSLRDNIGNKEREIMNKISMSSNKEEIKRLKITKDFFDYTLHELIKIEETCEEHLIKMKLNQLEELKNRMLPLSNFSWDLFPDVFKESDEETLKNDVEILSNCSCTNTEEQLPDVLLNSKVTMTQFDETDQKFFQELILLRTKIFQLPKTEKEKSGIENIVEILPDTQIEKFRMNKDFIEVVTKSDSFVIPNINEELMKITSLKFVDFEFRENEIWSKLLDSHGNQLRSKWIFVLKPRVERILKARFIPILKLNPTLTYNLLSDIKENGINFYLTKHHLISLLLDQNKDSIWLTSWKNQLISAEGKNIAVILIQAVWRGYRIRKLLRYFQILYIAASIIWSNWVLLKKKREIHERYLNRMLISLNNTEKLTIKLSENFDHFITKPHVILHISSFGHPLGIRGTFQPKVLSIFQNIMSLKMALARNNMSKIIYILPIAPTQELLLMYRNIIDSVIPKTSNVKRITYIVPSQVQTFGKRSMNLSRILYCSQDTLNTIKKRIAGKPAYLLPWILDECDIRISGDLNIPLLSPSIELQKKLLNASFISELMDELNLPQPPHVANIKNYTNLCSKLAERIVLNPEISLWLIKLNFGESNKYCATFLINHISVPFMPALRRERKKFRDEWHKNSDIREEYLQDLKFHLPQVVSSSIRLPGTYDNWIKFYAHLQKFGCLLQASPKEKKSGVVVITMFIPGKNSGKKPKWTGTADKIYLECNFPTVAYMIPQTFLEIINVESIVNKLAEVLQFEGYFGYLAIECYCYFLEHEEKMMAQVIDIYPFYSDCQQFVDWMKFAIDGQYSQQENLFTANVTILPEIQRRKNSLLGAKMLKWNETTERYAIAVLQLHHENMSRYQWSELKVLLEKEKISYNQMSKEGSHFLFHDGEQQKEGLLMTISSNMSSALKKIYNDVKHLNQLFLEPKKETESNFQYIADYFKQLSSVYQNLSKRKCD